MATFMTDLVLDSSTDANFRGWGKAISDRFAAFGWVKATDTGQIDWSTVTTSTTTGSIRGYEIWKMNDTLQATAPVFVKVEYSSGWGTAAEPRIFVTSGTGSNSSGTLTGQVGARVEARFSGSGGASTAFRCIFSGDESRFNLCLGINTENQYRFIWLNLERSKDATGADTAEGVVHMVGGGGSGASQQFLPMSGPIPPNETNLACLAPQQGTGVMGTDVILYPIFPFNVDMKNPVRGVVGYFKADITQDWVVQSTIYGVPQTFYALGHQIPGPMLRGTTNGVALRHE